MHPFRPSQRWTRSTLVVSHSFFWHDLGHWIWGCRPLHFLSTVVCGCWAQASYPLVYLCLVELRLGFWYPVGCGEIPATRRHSTDLPYLEGSSGQCEAPSKALSNIFSCPGVFWGLSLMLSFSIHKCWKVSYWPKLCTLNTKLSISFISTHASPLVSEWHKTEKNKKRLSQHCSGKD